MSVDLTSIESRRAAAASGEWMLLPEGLSKDGRTKYAVAITRHGNGHALSVAFYAARFATAEFLVAAHNTDIPELIAEVRRLRAASSERTGTGTGTGTHWRLTDRRRVARPNVSPV